MSKKIIITALIILLVHLALLILFASSRMFDMDEGVYLAAARMVGEGKALYTGFFYTQLMLMPTVFAPLAQDGWHSFWVLRGISAAFGFLSAVLLMVIVLKMTKDSKATLIALSLYCLSGMIISWHSVFKAHVFSHFLALGTFYFWLNYRERRNIISLILTGLILSAVINHRAVYIVLLPLYLISVWMLSSNYRLRDMIIFLLSLIPFSMPTLIKIITAGNYFFFDTFIFQLNRTENQSWTYLINNKLLTLAKTIVDPHLLIILILVILSVRLMRRNGKLSGMKDLLMTPGGMVLMNLILIAGIHLFPNPMMPQYVEQFISFGIILIALNLPAMLNYIQSVLSSGWRITLYAIIGLIYIAGFLPYLAIYLLDFRDSSKMYSISEVKIITGAMLDLGDRDDIVLSEWAGYPFLTGQSPLPYTEILGYEHPLPLNHEGYIRYRLADYEYLRERIADKVPKMVITINNPPEEYKEVLSLNYEPAFQSDRVTIRIQKE